MVHKGGKSEINCIKIFNHSKALEIPVGERYTENQLVHTSLHNFRRGGKYSAQIVSHQSELIREEIFVYQKSLEYHNLRTIIFQRFELVMLHLLLKRI